MVDRDVFDRRLGKLEDLLRQLRDLAAEGRKAFLADLRLQAAAERWLALAAECALDLAHHLIADRGWRTPATYREAFQILSEEEALTPECARQMETWAGLRNVLVNVYLDVDRDRIFGFLEKELGWLEEYAAELTSELERRG